MYSNKIAEDEIECESCGRHWNEQELTSHAWYCPNCKHKIGE